MHVDQMTTLERKIDHFAKILASKPGDELTILALAEASFRRGLKLEALTAYQDLVGGRPVPEAHLAVAEIYSAQGMPNEAYGELRRLFELDPDNVEARLLVNSLQGEVLPPEDLRQLMQRPTSEAAFDEAALRLKIQRAIYNRELQERTRNASLEPGIVVHEYHMEEAKKKLFRVDELLRELERFREYNRTLESEPPRPELVSAVIASPSTEADQDGVSADLSSELGELPLAELDGSPELRESDPEPAPAQEVELPQESPESSSPEEFAQVVEGAEPATESPDEAGSGSSESEASLDVAADTSDSEELKVSEERGDDQGVDSPVAEEQAEGQEFQQPELGATEESPAQQERDPEPLTLAPTVGEEALSDRLEDTPSGATPEPLQEPELPAEEEASLPSAEHELSPRLDMAPLPLAAWEEPATSSSFGADFPLSMDSLEPDLPDLTAELPPEPLLDDLLPGGGESVVLEPLSPRVEESEAVPVEPAPLSEEPLPESEVAVELATETVPTEPTAELPEELDSSVGLEEVAVSAPAEVAASETSLEADFATAAPAPTVELESLNLAAPRGEANPGEEVASGELSGTAEDSAEALPVAAYATLEMPLPAQLSAARKAFYQTHAEALSALTQTLARTRGVTSIYLVAREGVAIESVAKDDISEERIGEIVSESFEFLEAFAADPAYWVLECSGGIFVMQRLDARHVLIAIGQAGANFGALRYTMDKTRAKFEQILSQVPD